MIILPDYEIDKLNITNCLKCNKVLTDTNLFCYDCYKCNLNTLYKIIKKTTPINDMNSCFKQLVKHNKNIIKIKENKNQFKITFDDTNDLIVEI